MHAAVARAARPDTTRAPAQARASLRRKHLSHVGLDRPKRFDGSASATHAALTLLRNDVTHIVYTAGGFFKAHQDFLSLVSNCVEEYTLLICALPPEAAGVTRGGLTRVTAGGGRVLESAATTTAGCALLFRKDMVHEGLPVLAGGKEVVALNLWATRHDCTTLLRVVFPHAGSSSAKGSPLERPTGSSPRSSSALLR